nr:hypothetical protein BaRGS_034157 [Batillaria attramentaria]
MASLLHPVKTLKMAFLDLQRTLPAVPRDTKLSKLDVLVLATTYIAHLTRALAVTAPCVDCSDGYCHHDTQCKNCGSVPDNQARHLDFSSTKTTKMSSEIEPHITKKYEIKKRLGKGAYGIVWKAIDRRTGEVVAVKKIFDAFRNQTDAQRTFREIMFLQEFGDHPNVIKLHNVIKAENDKDIYLVFEFMETDLHNVIKRGNILKDVHKRYVMYQLFKATKYLHSGNVIHRDLKPSNILLDSECIVKLCDFGLARSLTQIGIDEAGDPNLTEYVATRWYRAPEILLASHRPKKPLEDMLSEAPVEGVDLMRRLLQFNPDKRITADEALRHPFVSRFHNPAEEVSLNFDVVPPLSDDVQLTVDQYRSKLYEMIMQKKAERRRRRREEARSAASHQVPEPEPEEMIPMDQGPKENAALPPNRPSPKMGQRPISASSNPRPKPMYGRKQFNNAVNNPSAGAPKAVFGSYSQAYGTISSTGLAAIQGRKS